MKMRAAGAELHGPRGLHMHRGQKKSFTICPQNQLVHPRSLCKTHHCNQDIGFKEAYTQFENQTTWPQYREEKVRFPILRFANMHKDVTRSMSKQHENITDTSILIPSKKMIKN